MKEYHTHFSNRKYGFDNTPSEELRLFDEEIKSAAEFERDSMAFNENKQLSVVREEENEEFSIENSRSEVESSP